MPCFSYCAFNFSERKMWYLLVAAGAGYLATKWQTAQRPHLLCEQNGRTSSPSSPPCTPRRELDSSLSDTIPTSPKVVNGPRTGFNSLQQKSSANGVHIFSDKCVYSPHQAMKSNKRSTCDAYLATLVQAKREEDQLVLTSQCSLTAVDYTDGKEEQLLREELSSSPSSCCSSVINSPIDSTSVLQRCDRSLNFQGKELGTQLTWRNGVFHFQGKEQNKQLNELPNQIFSTSLNSNIEGDRDVSTMRRNRQAGPLQHAVSSSYFSDCIAVVNTAATTGNESRGATGIHTPLSYSGKRQRDDTRADIFLDNFVCTQLSNCDARQATSHTAARKSWPPISPLCSVVSQKASNKTGHADSDAFVSFGLAMAVCFMVSSSKNEMEKMGKVLRETEDLVSGMRKELEERKLRSCMDEEDNDEFFTIKPKDSAQQECNFEVVMNPSDTCGKNGHCFCNKESPRSMVPEAAVQNQLCMYNIEETCQAGSNHAKTNTERRSEYVNRVADDGKGPNQYGHFDEESDSEEEGENDCTMSLIELERKLWQVFQERQELRILELEEALELALSRLHAKEEELRWWKNRASWLMEQSTSASTKSYWKRIEGFKCKNEEGVQIERQFSSVEPNLSAVEGCIGGVGVEDSCLNLIVHGNGSVKTSSTCSIGSGESVLSIDIRAFT
ncbi:hypothetical protein L7F22_064840 [Adiantum nelumboides]|nr:hypothetical protein [Adiantum nelumboides]